MKTYTIVLTFNDGAVRQMHLDADSERDARLKAWNAMVNEDAIVIKSSVFEKPAILDDAVAMDAVKTLQAKGVTGEQVAQFMPAMAGKRD